MIFGGCNFIVVESIWVTKTHNNYRYVILALSYLDTMINGQGVERENDNDKAIGILCDLVRNAANGMLKTIKIDNFVLCTFQCFVENKKEIKLDESFLVTTNNKIRDTIMYGMVEYKSEIRKFTKLKETDLTNLFRPELFTIFSQAKSLILKVRTGLTYHPFSFSALLKVIKMCNLEKVVIEVVQQFSRGTYDCWIQQLWEKSGKELKAIYQAENYSINMEITRWNKLIGKSQLVIKKQINNQMIVKK